MPMPSADVVLSYIRRVALSELVTIDVNQNGVADVRLNRPDKYNALSPDMFDAITEAGESLIDDRVIMNIKKNIKKYENINKNINEVCVICLDEYCSKDNILILDCTHYYHSECLIDWFKKNPSYTCPLCRSETI